MAEIIQERKAKCEKEVNPREGEAVEDTVRVKMKICNRKPRNRRAIEEHQEQ